MGEPVQEPAISIGGAHRAYADRAILIGFDLLIRRGEIYALLDGNSTSKLTILSTLLGFYTALTLHGRAMLTYVSESIALYDYWRRLSSVTCSTRHGRATWP